ncbi:UNVERIFIED_CONTAM: hypothetical protein HDU68_006520 [Siphonaria sp. JEL0065]|nr:hypothetical protein HDU68_006520 [Siphonaria sp. JEL0065]
MFPEAQIHHISKSLSPSKSPLHSRGLLPPPSMHALLSALPSELIQEILKQLPIDPSLLHQASFASKSLFGRSILRDFVFAKQHFHHQLGTQNLWEFLDENGIYYDGWLALPHTYKVAIYAVMLVRERWDRSDEKMELSKNLFYCLRWFMTDSTALHIITDIKKLYPRYDFTVHKNRPIRWSCRMGHAAAVELLLQNPHVDPSDEDCLALHWACEQRHTDVILLLLEDVRIDPSFNGNFPIKVAAQEGLLEIVERLLEDRRGSGVDPSTQNNFAVRLAAQNGHIEVVTRLLREDKVDPSDHNNYAIILASRNGHASMVRLLMSDSRVHPHANTNEAVTDASRNGHLEVVRHLLSNPLVDPSDRGSDSLKFAATRGHFDVVLLLLKDPRIDVAVNRQVVLKSAAEAGRMDIVKALFAHPRRSAIRIKDNHYRAIQNAMGGQHWEIARYLLARIDKTFTQPVHQMALSCLKAVVNEL